MEPPALMYHGSVRDEQVKVFHTVPPLDPADLVRGQFRGYRQEPGVTPKSQMETFAAVRLHIESWCWAGVPFVIRAGKCLPVTTEVLVKLRQPPLTNWAAGESNYLRVRLSPQISLNLGARIKRPGATMVSMPVELSAVERSEGDELDPYDRLLGDAMRGDALLFVRQDAVQAAWSIVEPILGDVTPVHEYEPGTWGPAEAKGLAADIEGWHNPQEEP